MNDELAWRRFWFIAKYIDHGTRKLLIMPYAKTNLVASTKTKFLPRKRRYLLEKKRYQLCYWIASLPLEFRFSVSIRSLHSCRVTNNKYRLKPYDLSPTAFKITLTVSSGTLKNGLCPVSISTTSTASFPPFLPSLDLQTSIADCW